MVNAGRKDLGIVSEVLRLGLKLGAATAFDFLLTVHQIGEKTAYLLSDGSASAQAQIGRHFLARPAPDRFISVEVRTVGGQVHQAQVQVGRGEISPDRVAPMGWRIVPNHRQWFGVLRP